MSASSEPPQPLLSVLIPVYNESRTLRTIIKRVLASPISLPMELVCVDASGAAQSTPHPIERLAAGAGPTIKIDAPDGVTACTRRIQSNEML